MSKTKLKTKPGMECEPLLAVVNSHNKVINYWDNEKQNNFKADYGFASPHRTKTKCKQPVFADHYLHRIAIMKDEHFGNKGDRDINGLPGYVSKFICTGCGKKYTIDKIKGYFHPDTKAV